jgi:hypothetical protein
VKKPALRRAEARERLRQVTDVSNVSDVKDEKKARESVTEEGEQAPVVADSTSISEQEWYGFSYKNLSKHASLTPLSAICLSTLHAPSPPAPALLAPSTTTTTFTDEATIHHPISSSSDPEPILKLHTCSHTFHAECLVSWFVLRKTTCPICRAPYISKEDMTAYEEEEVAATTPVVEQMAVVEPVRVSNWRYFWAGESVTRREQGGEAVTATDVERQSGGSGRRGLRLWRRGGG